MYKRVILIVLDSVGVGAANDADRFGDSDANTVKHIGDYCQANNKMFQLPNLSAYGLGKIVSTYGLDASATLKGAYGVLSEISPGKDTSTGHWEMAGTPLSKEFPVFENGFDESLLSEWCKRNDLPGILGNYAASGTTIIMDLGEEHLKTGKPIVYTSADSVFQVACSEESFGLERLYAICKDARKLLDPLGIGRIIARPFIGKTADTFNRTENRRDYSLPPPSPNLLDVIREQNAFVAGVGKIEDIFCHRSVNIVEHTGRNETSLLATEKLMAELKDKGLIFTNLIDFDQLHGHRRNPKTYADALMDFDKFLPRLEAQMGEDDLLILTADHGNDPTHTGSDHTRENIPLLAFSKNNTFRSCDLGEYHGFNHIARLCLEALGMKEQVTKIEGLDKTASLYESMHP